MSSQLQVEEQTSRDQGARSTAAPGAVRAGRIAGRQRGRMGTFLLILLALVACRPATASGIASSGEEPGADLLGFVRDRLGVPSYRDSRQSGADDDPYFAAAANKGPDRQWLEQDLANVPPPGFKVAFIADQGAGSDATAVLQLIQAEGTDLVLHQGDFDYQDNPDAWDQKITDVLGADFPYFISVGNHDVVAWSGPNGYQAKFQQRLALIPDAHCTGELGVNSTCIYKGLAIVLSGVGTLGTDHEAYIQQEFAADNHIWRICSWHKNMTMMQMGSKNDDTGWGVYEACRQAGAIVATGHEHSYSRTYLMTSFENQVIANTSSTLELDAGQSFAFVSGLGGASIRNQDQNWPWMAAVYTSDQNANYGALFCTFNVNGRPDRAQCAFKDIDGVVADQFVVVSNLAFHASLPVVPNGDATADPGGSACEREAAPGLTEAVPAPFPVDSDY